MNYSEKLLKDAGVKVEEDQPAIQDPEGAKRKAILALKYAMSLSYFPVIMWGFAGSVSGGFLDFFALGLLTVVSLLFWVPAKLAISECRVVLRLIKREDIFKYVSADAARALSMFTLFIWLPIWALMLACADKTILPIGTMAGVAVTVILSVFRYSSRVCKQYEQPKRFKWVEGWGREQRGVPSDEVFSPS